MTYTYKTTNEYFDLLNFHDCPVQQVTVEDNTITFDFEFLYISEEHPLNPHETAKSTDPCRLTFSGVTKFQARVNTDGKSLGGLVKPVELVKMEFLEVKQEVVDDYIVYEILTDGRGFSGFCEITIKARGFTLELNEFLEDAWYVGWKEYWGLE